VDRHTDIDMLSTIHGMRHRGNKICPDKWTNAADGQPENIMPLQTLSGGIKTWREVKRLLDLTTKQTRCYGP